MKAHREPQLASNRHVGEVSGDKFAWNAHCSCGWVCCNLASLRESQDEMEAHLRDA